MHINLSSHTAGIHSSTPSDIGASDSANFDVQSSTARMTQTQIQGAAYRMRRTAVGRPITIPSTFDRLRRFNAALDKGRAKINDEPGNIETVLNESNGEAFYRLKVTRFLSKKFPIPQNELRNLAIADAAASTVAGGGTCGELTAHATTGTELRDGERIDHMFNPGQRPTRWALGVPSHHYAVLLAGPVSDSQEDLVGDGLSKDSAMFVEDTNVDLNTASPLYSIKADEVENIQAEVGRKIEALQNQNPDIEKLLSQARPAGIPSGKVPFSIRPSIIKSSFATQSKNAIHAMSEPDRDELAITSAIQEVPSLSREEAESYKEQIIAAATTEQ